MRFQITAPTIREVLEMQATIRIPPFQRGQVWGKKKQSLLIDSILRGYDLPKFYFLKNGTEKLDCLDGQQRLTAIFSFLNRQLIVNGKKFSQMNNSDCERFLKYRLTFSTCTGATEGEFKELYSRLQEGVVLSAGEKLKAAEGTEVLSRIQESEMFKNLGFNLSRSKSYLLAMKCLLMADSVQRDLTYRGLRAWNNQKSLALNAESAIKILKRMNEGFGIAATEMRRQADFCTAFVLFKRSPDASPKSITSQFLSFLQAVRETRVGNTNNRSPTIVSLLLRYAEYSNRSIDAPQRLNQCVSIYDAFIQNRIPA